MMTCGVWLQVLQGWRQDPQACLLTDSMFLQEKTREKMSRDNSKQYSTARKQKGGGGKRQTDTQVQRELGPVRS